MPFINMNYEQATARMEEIHESMERIGAKHRLSKRDEAEFSALREEFRELEDHCDRLRTADELTKAGRPGSRLRIDRGSPDLSTDSDRPALRQRDEALRVLDRAVNDNTMPARGAETIEHVIDNGAPQARSYAARWAATTADPHYLSAFTKLLQDPTRGHMVFTPQEAEAFRTASELQMEQRAMSLTDTAGGFLIPAQLDASVILTSNGSVNPILDIARVEATTADVWTGVSSAGVTASWDAEAAEVSDDTPTLASPSVPLYKGAAFVPFSIEIEQDAPTLVAELTKLLLDSVAQLSATSFVTGSGTGEPTGFVTALVAASPSVIVTSDGSEVIATGDPIKLQNALPPRFQPNSRFVAALPTINTFRKSETSNGALLYPSLQNDPPTLLGRPIHEVSNMDSAINASASEANYVLAVGDWSHYLVAVKLGTKVELVPHLFGSSRRPTGQRGFYAHFRIGADSLVDNAFRILNVPTTA